jgi:hypothetical protein
MQANRQPPRGRERSDLDDHYGKIGISALAAALRYRGETKNPAYAPVPVRPHDDGDDIAA